MYVDDVFHPTNPVEMPRNSRKDAKECTKLLETTVFKMKGQDQQMPKKTIKLSFAGNKNTLRIKEDQSRMTGFGRNSLYSIGQSNFSCIPHT